MKKLLLPLLIVLPVSLCLADVAVYKGSQVVKTTSSTGVHTVVERLYEVVDLQTGEMVTVTLAKIGGKNSFSISEPSTVIKTSVNDSRGAGKSFTVYAQASSSSNVDTGVSTVWSFLQKGQELPVLIKGDVKAPVAKTLQGAASQVTTAGINPENASAIAAAYVDIKSTLQLLLPLSKTSNDAADTLAAAVERLKTQLVADKFTDASVQ